MVQRIQHHPQSVAIKGKVGSAHYRKTAKYSALVPACEENCYGTYFFAFEVGFLWSCPHSLLHCFEALCLQKSTARQIRSEASQTAIRCSYILFLRRGIPTWENLQALYWSFIFDCFFPCRPTTAAFREYSPAPASYLPYPPPPPHLTRAPVPRTQNSPPPPPSPPSGPETKRTAYPPISPVLVYSRIFFNLAKRLHNGVSFFAFEDFCAASSMLCFPLREQCCAAGRYGCVLIDLIDLDSFIAFMYPSANFPEPLCIRVVICYCWPFHNDKHMNRKILWVLAGVC